MHIVVDTDTGAITGEIQQGDRIVRSTSIDKYINSIELNKNEPFIKIFSNVLFDLSEDLTGKESLFLYYLIQYINYDDGILEKNRQLLTREIMIQETKQTERTIDRLLLSLVEKEILGKHKTGTKKFAYIVNPFIFMKGKRINKTLYELFKKTKWANIKRM